MYVPLILYNFIIFDVRGSVHHSTNHKNPTRCNSVSHLSFHIYMKLNMFRATHRPSSGA